MTSNNNNNTPIPKKSPFIFKEYMQKQRYFIARTISKLAILILFIIGYELGVPILIGNLSGATLFDTIPLADPFALIQIFASGAIASSKILIGALIVVVFYALFFGRAFCSWVCPVSIITEFALFLRKKLRIDDSAFKIFLKRDARYLVMALSIALSIVFGIAAFEFISPVSMMHRGIIFGLGFAWTVLLVVFLFDLFILKDGFCGHLCPLGAFYALLGKFSLFKVRFIKSRCTDCKDCLKTCPEVQVIPHLSGGDATIKNGECTLCARCIEVCETDALVWSFAKK